MPADVRSLPPFRKLRDGLGSEASALLVWWVLFCEFHYRLQEGETAGRASRAEVAGMLDELRGLLKSEMPKSETAAPDDVWKRDRLELERIVMESGLLRGDGDEVVCPRFQALHGAGTGARSAAQRGGDLRAFDLRQRRVEEQAFQQSLGIAASKFVDEKGEPLDNEATRRVTRLIVGCDNALFKGSRPPIGFTEGLIQDGLRVLAKYREAEVDALLRHVALARGHPALNGMTTEKLLPQLGEMAGKL